MNTYDYIRSSGDSFLSHHGIKGQRWGVRNGPPYPLSDKVAKRVRKEVQKIENKKYYNDREKAWRDSSILRDVRADEGVLKATRRISDLQKNYLHKYNENQDAYARLAGKYAHAKSRAGTSMTEQDMIDWYVHDDGDQGTFNSYSFFIVANSKDPWKAIKDILDSWNSYIKAGDSAVDKILGKNGDLRVKTEYADSSLSRLIKSNIDAGTNLWEMNWMINEGFYGLTKSDVEDMKKFIKSQSGKGKVK